MVEIYQGCRMNYERPGAPRSPTADFNLGGFEPKGFINLALLKGIKFSFQSSSDHGSTHISYALVYAENNSRDAMFAAMKKRHTYAATDNIIADFRCTADGRQYIMGDAFESKAPPTVRIKLHGTQPFAKVTLIKDIRWAEPLRPHIERDHVHVGDHSSLRRQVTASGAIDKQTPLPGPIGATGQTMPAKFSARNDVLDRTPIMAFPIKLSDEERKQIFVSVMADKSQPAADAEKLSPASELSTDQALNGMHPLPDGLRNIDLIQRLKFVKAKDKVLLVEPSTRIVVEQIKS
jgi:hypothetical protein